MCICLSNSLYGTMLKTEPPKWILLNDRQRKCLEELLDQAFKAISDLQFVITAIKYRINE